MKIFLPNIKTNVINSTLSDAEFFRKNVIYLNKLRQITFLYGIDDKTKIILESLLKYFEEIEEYRYCTDIMRIFEMYKNLFDTK